MYESAFSPEDLASNTVGVILAKAFIETNKGDFSTFAIDMDLALVKTLGDLRAVDKNTAQKVFENQVDGKWVKNGLGLGNNFQLLKRNMTATPWLLPINGSTGKVPAWLQPPIPARDYYSVSVRDSAAGINWNNVDLAKKVADLTTMFKNDFGIAHIVP